MNSKINSAVLLTVLFICTAFGANSKSQAANPAGNIRSNLKARVQNRLQSRMQSRQSQSTQGSIDCESSPNVKFANHEIAGLDIAAWAPASANGAMPLVIFSHGLHGRNTQSRFIMEALAQNGYLVLAPNHKDAAGEGSPIQQEFSVGRQGAWDDTAYEDRGEDIARLLKALEDDPNWSKRIDWSKVALAGHSLGGYTVLALSGGWPSWKLPNIKAMPNIKAILALSPYTQPLVAHGQLNNVEIPIMYQSGTRDLGVLLSLIKPNGALEKSPSPTYFINFNGAGHMAWTNFNKNKAQRDQISYYCVSFLDKYVKGIATANPQVKLSTVARLNVK
jgi:dienelactone hydrolase